MTPSRGNRREELLVAALAVLPLLPFLGKAVSIDAPVFVAVAHQILEEPADPFGFEMIWDPTSPEAAVFNRNPPLLSYYLAPWIGVFGERDVVLHAAMLPFALLASLSFLGIARRVAGEGLAPAALLLATPAFLVLATTLMLDIPMLAFTCAAVYALLRGAEGERAGWDLAAGFATAAAALMKYVGFAVAPLVVAGVVLLHPRRMGALVRVAAPPLLIWTAWGAYTASLYGHAHFLGSTDVVLGRDPDHLWNQLATVPIYYGAALVFPVFAWVRTVAGSRPGTPLAVLALVLGTAVATLVLPHGQPDRRHPIDMDGTVIAALGFAGAVLVWATLLDPRRLRANRTEIFLGLWLGGFLVFTALLNWHVNAADALIAAPPALLLLYRREALRPSARAAWIWVALMLPFSLLLAWADAVQAGAYRDAARRVATEIGDQPGSRWFVGHWGLQHYLEREGFQAVVPPTYGRSELAVGDWVATARNVSQLDVYGNMARYVIRPVWSFESTTKLPLRTTNPDAGAGFYSHHSGYVPFGFGDAPIDRVDLGRVTQAR